MSDETDDSTPPLPTPTSLVAGLPERAEHLLGKFNWGQGFLSLNQELLSQYAQCSDSADVTRVQEETLTRSHPLPSFPRVRAVYLTLMQKS